MEIYVRLAEVRCIENIKAQQKKPLDIGNE